jgi:hypothetical protein
MSQRVTLQEKIGRSVTTNPLDERIDPYQSIGWASRSGTHMIISPKGAARPAVGGNARKKKTAAIPFAGSQRSSSLKTGLQ